MRRIRPIRHRPFDRAAASRHNRSRHIGSDGHCPPHQPTPNTSAVRAIPCIVQLVIFISQFAICV